MGRASAEELLIPRSIPASRSIASACVSCASAASAHFLTSPASGASASDDSPWPAAPVSLSRGASPAALALALERVRRVAAPLTGPPHFFTNARTKLRAGFAPV